MKIFLALIFVTAVPLSANANVSADVQQLQTSLSSQGVSQSGVLPRVQFTQNRSGPPEPPPTGGDRGGTPEPPPTGGGR